MNASLVRESHSLALELHAFVRSLDRARFREEWASGAEETLAALKGRLEDLVEVEPSATLMSLHRHLDEVSEVMARYSPAASRREEWLALGRQLTPAYEALAASLSDYELHCPNIRPSNLSRSIFHMTSATLVVLLIEMVLDPSHYIWITGPVFAAAIVMETSRRFSTRINDLLLWVFRSVAHPHEAHRVNSATWYAAAMVMLSIIGSPLIGAVAVGILGYADPLAAIVGRRYGKTRLANGRSLEGTCTFVVVGTAVSATIMLLGHPELGVGFALGAAFIAALLAGIAELFATYIDDNLAIPAAAAAGMGLALFMAG